MAHELPEGFTAHEGGDCPIGDHDYARMAILTDEGVAITPFQKARYHEWKHSEHEDLIGAVVGYSLVSGEEDQS